MKKDLDLSNLDIIWKCQDELKELYPEHATKIDIACYQLSSIVIKEEMKRRLEREANENE